MTPAAGETLARKLLGVLAEHGGGLSAVYAILDLAVAELELQTVAVVVGDDPFAQQLFRAGRKLRVDDGALALDRPGLYADPPIARDEDSAAIVTDACRAALRLPVAVSTEVVTHGDEFARRFDAHTAHARRAGCRFAFVLVAARVPDERELVGARLRRNLRGDDSAHPISPTEIALILPLLTGDHVGPVLERAAATTTGPDERVCPPFTYSVVIGPDEADAPEAALALARERHRTVTETLVEDHRNDA